MIDLAGITLADNGSNGPKALAPYTPQPRSQRHLVRILDVYGQMASAGAVPLGPRQVGYRLKEAFPGEYVKDRKGRDGSTTFEAIERYIRRLRQAGQLWDWVADASAAAIASSTVSKPSSHCVPPSATAHGARYTDQRPEVPCTWHMAPPSRSRPLAAT